MIGMIWCGFFWSCALIFASIGLYSLLLKLPVSIWYRYDIDPSRLTDVKAYNLAAAIVWFSYALLFVIAGFIGFSGAYKAGLIFSALLIIPGIPMISIALKRILLHFTIKAVAAEIQNDVEEKSTETVQNEKSELEEQALQNDMPLLEEGSENDDIKVDEAVEVQ